MIGASTSPARDSHNVMKYLLAKGYRVIPVNPLYDEVLGQKCYPDLKSISCHIDIVNVFRKPEALSIIVEETLYVKPDVLWLQLGLTADKYALSLINKGIRLVSNKYIKVEHFKLIG